MGARRKKKEKKKKKKKRKEIVSFCVICRKHLECE